MKAFNEGASAFIRGQVGNPYSLNTNNHREWERGWNTEYFKNLERLKNESVREGG